MPTYSTIRKAAAPITGGMIWPLIEAEASMAPAFTPDSPVRFISGMVKMPPDTTLETDEPETTPLSAEETTATLAGPPRRWPSSAIEICIIQLPAPAFSRSVPNSTNRKTKLVETPSAMPNTPFGRQPLMVEELRPATRRDAG